MKLYCFGESGNAYKCALALELTQTPWQPVYVDFFKGEARSPAFLAVNEMGEVPVLVDGDLTLLPVDPQVLAFVRTHGDERLLCAFNLSTEPATLALPAGDQVDARSTLSFDPYGVRFARLTRV